MKTSVQCIYVLIIFIQNLNFEQELSKLLFRPPLLAKNRTEIDY